LAVAFSLIALLFLNKGELILFFNAKDAKFIVFFSYVTKLAEFLSIAIVSLFVLLFASRKEILLFAMTMILSSMLAQGLKHYVFSGEKRPSHFFELQEIESVQRSVDYTFPSGHTTAAFALFGSLAIILKKRGLQFACFVLAMGVGLSRMVLGQHFFYDVIAGAVLGMFVLLTIRALLEPRLRSQELDKRLVNV
jgi:membrane-associated phospholipid phosphatase